MKRATLITTIAAAATLSAGMASADIRLGGNISVIDKPLVQPIKPRVNWQKLWPKCPALFSAQLQRSNLVVCRWTYRSSLPGTATHYPDNVEGVLNRIQNHNCKAMVNPGEWNARPYSIKTTRSGSGSSYVYTTDLICKKWDRLF
jgi:hypothetical protein